MADGETVTVAVASADAFDPDHDDGDFRRRHDRFKDAIVLPNSVFDRLFGPDRHTGYVEPTVDDAPDEQSDPLYALRFAEDYDGPGDVDAGADDGIGAAVDDAEFPIAYLRLNEQDALGCDPDDELSLVRLAPVESAECGPLTVRRDSTYRESTEERVCRISPALAADSGLEPGDDVEVVSAKTHGRILLELRTSPTVSEDSIALSTHARKLLDVKLDYKVDSEESDENEVTLRRPLERRPKPSAVSKVLRGVFERFVGYNEIQLRTVIGLNADENRDVVRADAETLDILGIEPGDRIVLESLTAQTTARCLPLDSDAYLVQKDDDLRGDDINPTTILVPSTERDEADVVVDDVLSVRRDMGYTTGKRVVPSILGILGVFLTGLQALGLVDADLASPTVLLGVGATLVTVSVGMVWVVLWPERQKCSL